MSDHKPKFGLKSPRNQLNNSNVSVVKNYPVSLNNLRFILNTLDRV